MTTTSTCPHCGAASIGKFCSSCGSSLGPVSCAGCGAPLSPGAKFCHKCGRPTSGVAALGRSKGPWVFAGILSVALVGWVILLVNRGVEVAPPPAGQTAGANAPFAAGGGSGGPPDLSQMTPRDAFLRLHDRIMGALEQGDTATATQFTPMAIQSYGMLSSAERDFDIRYHAATLLMGSNDLDAAKALTDSMAREVPGHLFVDMLRAGIAEGKDDPAATKRAYRQFLMDFDAQVATGRREYVDHRPLLDAFKERAVAVGR